eukprot:ANDGO_00572.mRNA.1 transcription elongation factor S-II
MDPEDSAENITGLCSAAVLERVVEWLRDQSRYDLVTRLPLVVGAADPAVPNGPDACFEADGNGTEPPLKKNRLAVEDERVPRGLKISTLSEFKCILVQSLENPIASLGGAPMSTGVDQPGLRTTSSDAARAKLQKWTGNEECKQHRNPRREGSRLTIVSALLPIWLTPLLTATRLYNIAATLEAWICSAHKNVIGNSVRANSPYDVSVARVAKHLQHRSVLWDMVTSQTISQEVFEEMIVGKKDFPGVSDEIDLRNDAIRKEALRQAIRNVFEVEREGEGKGIFTCRKCKGERTVWRQVQLNSGDEPMTVFVTCLDCGAVTRD